MSMSCQHIAAPNESFHTIDIDLGTLRVQLLSLGAAIRTVEVPDSQGVLGHVHLALETVADHADSSANPHLGGTLGRYANRIAQGRFTLDDEEFQLDKNSDGNTLHGGSRGFDRQVWAYDLLVDKPDRASVAFHLSSPDGDMGFPGRVEATVTYDITPTSISMHYLATTDAPTVISLSNHGYWNLAGSHSVAGHHLSVAAERRLVTNAIGIPVAVDEVADTLFDLRTPRVLGPIIDDTQGLDSCYLVDGQGFRQMAHLSAPAVGRSMTVSSDAPGVQVYTGNNLRAPFEPFQSVSLETQRAPDAPNQPEWGSAILRPDEQYETTTVLEFSVGESSR